MKRIMIAVLLAGILVLTACGEKKTASPTTRPESVSQTEPASVSETTPESQPQTVSSESPTTAETQADAEFSPTEEPQEESMLKLSIGDTPVAVEWEENEAVQALKAMCRKQPLTIAMSMYGGFEQVGSIGVSLPASDEQTTTSAGDIVLYSGDQMVVFYGSNTWAYTRLGHITDKTQAQLTQLLSNGNVSVTITA